MASQPNQALVNYIWTYLHQGYSLTSIRSQLQQNGYNPKDINLAIDYVYANYYYGKTSPESDPRKTLSEQQPKHFGIELPSVHSIVPIVLVIIGVFLFGFATIFILFMNPTETITVPSNQNYQEPIVDDTPPQNIPADDIENSSPSLTENEDNQNTENTQPRIPEPTIPKNPDVDQPFEAGTQYTPRQIDLKVAYFGSRDPKEAMKFCDIIERDVERYFCYSDVAQYSGNYQYCESITENKYEDDCYLNLVLEDSSLGAVCEFIENGFKKDNCNTVAEYAQIEFDQNIEIPDEPEELNPADYASVADFY